MKRFLTVATVLVAVLALGAASGTTYRSVVTFTKGLVSSDDITVSAAGAIEGIPKIEAVSTGGVMANGTTENINYVDDTPDGEWAEVDAGTAVTLTADTTTKKVGSKSLKLAFTAAAVDGDGAVNDITNDDLEANESIGGWIYSTKPLAAGELELLIDDTDADPDIAVDFPAVAASTWTWFELDISALAAGNGNDVDKIHVLLTADVDAMTNPNAFSVYLDYVYKWDAATEEALGVDLVGEGAVLWCQSVVDANTGVHTLAFLAEGTDYFVAWRSGNDSIVVITDQSTKSGLCVAAYNS
ncbi:MAG TPA: hypothetical protein PLN64_00850 [Candidatus Bipolaricaulis anaerobius]|nr:hypothetical protein [Candidatus Bipolaricaulis anaerobius]